MTKDIFTLASICIGNTAAGDDSDLRPTFGSVLSNLNASIALLDANLSVPGCWAYLDMMEVGVTNTQVAGGRQNNCGPDGEQKYMKQ